MLSCVHYSSIALPTCVHTCVKDDFYPRLTCALSCPSIFLHLSVPPQRMFRAALSWDCTAGTDAVILSRHCVLVTLPNISVVVWGVAVASRWRKVWNEAEVLA